MTLKNFATPWTNRDQTVFAPLNDYTATVIGMVRDDVPFNQVLSADILYTGQGIAPAYSPSSNAHYEAMDDQGADLKAVLVRQTQSSFNGIPAAATAGVMTSRAASEAFFIAGTNRAMFRFTLINHLCHDLEQSQDTSRPPDRIRQDVSRSPGGDSRIFLNNCVGCHSGMDPMAQAFAYYNYDETVRLASCTPPARCSRSTSSTWTTSSRVTSPRTITGTTAGARDLMRCSAGRARFPAAAMAPSRWARNSRASEAFAQCQVEKVFRNVCFRDPSDGADRAQVTATVASFKGNNYSLKRVFAEAAAYCKGD